MGISVWSLDDGYGDGKGNNGRNKLVIPSYVTDWRPMQKMELGNGEKLDPYSHIGVEVDGKKYLVGKGAMEQDPKLTWVGGNNKHLDNNFPIFFKTMLGLLANNLDEVILEPLVMGLPVKADEDEGRHKLLEDIAYNNTHKVKIELADGKVLDKSIYIKDLIIKKQPFGGYCDVILDGAGEIQEPKIASSYSVVVDIGARTLNIYTLNALEPIYDLSDTTNHGMFTAYGWVGKFIEDRVGQKVNSGKLPLIIQNEEIKGINLRPAILRSYETLSNQIFGVVDTMFADSWAFVDTIIFTGGGSHLLKPWLERMFKGKETIFLDRHANARGLRKYGFREAKKKGVVVYSTPNRAYEKTPGGGISIKVGGKEQKAK